MAKNNTQAPEKDIVSFNQALELCSLGFDETTFCMYEIENKQLCLCYLDEDGLYMPDKDFHAPTKSQVFRWFREKYDISVYITRNIHFVDDNTKWKPVVGNIYYPHLTFDTYEKAENAAIDKLIELAKQQAIS
jgi:predicted GNAT superfamily acetyltransferase